MHRAPKLGGRLEWALEERERPGQPRRTDAKQEAFLVALASSHLPAGRTRWTLRLLAARIEATATTFWFGFKDDVVIRITAANAGSLLDVRSISRLGRSDLGTNARRIREYLSKLR